jgi:poly(3-hydroxyalkanoate) depolymerase
MSSRNKRSPARLAHEGVLRLSSTSEGGGIDVHDVEVNGQMLRVAIKDGPLDKPPLLLFNGIGANWELARPLFDALTGRRAIIFDVPGIGGSPLPSAPYRLSAIAKLGANLVTELGHNLVDVGGVSWGGGPAQEFALNYPNLCRRLILAATTPGVLMVPGNPLTVLKLATPRRYFEKDYLRRNAAEIYGGAFRHDPELIAKHAKGMGGLRSLGYLFQLLALAGWINLPWLRSITQPTLVLMGSDDPLVPAINGKILAYLIPNATLEMIDDGHLFMVAKPIETAAAIERFLA